MRTLDTPIVAPPRRLAQGVRLLDSDFWRDLTSKFLLLDPRTTLRAERRLSPSGPGPWFIVGTGAEGLSVYRRFIPLAKRAATRLPDKKATNLLDEWLIALEPYISQAVRTVKDVEYVERLCGESADLCSIFEGEALERE